MKEGKREFKYNGVIVLNVCLKVSFKYSPTGCSFVFVVRKKT